MAVQKKVMVVDDNDTIRTILANHLKHDGYTAVEAASAPAAMDLALAGGIDLILLDLMMPQTDGMELLEALKNTRKTQAIPVVMISAFGQKENIVEAIKAGAADFVVKPFTRAEFLEKVRKMLSPGGLSE